MSQTYPLSRTEPSIADCAREPVLTQHVARLAYVELHDDEKAQTVTGFIDRALVFFAAHGIGAKRLLSDG